MQDGPKSAPRSTRSHLPASSVALREPLAPLFDPRAWRQVLLLLLGAVRAPRQRPVSAALHVLGVQAERRFAVCHQGLTRARWALRAVSRVLLGLLIRPRAPTTGPLILGLDETSARRQGKQTTATGVYRDGVRASHRHCVKPTGLRWLRLMWLADIPWAGRVWAVPCLTAPAPRHHAARGCRHTTITDWARPMRGCGRRWRPDRDRVVVGDRRAAALRVRAACQQMAPALTFITRRRRDAARAAPRGRPC